MFKRDVSLYLNDIQESIAAIEGFTHEIDYEFFHNDRKTYSATLREFIVIGEAIVHIPEAVKAQFPAIQWRLIKDFRNFIVHEYFGVDPRIVWDAVQQELPLLKTEMARLRTALPST
jgi:uncharacterized protein with HEPN domain